MALSRKERAARCFEAAREEISFARQGIARKETAIMLARFYVRKGRAFLYTTERVNIRSDLRPW